MNDENRRAESAPSDDAAESLLGDERDGAAGPPERAKKKRWPLIAALALVTGGAIAVVLALMPGAPEETAETAPIGLSPMPAEAPAPTTPPPAPDPLVTIDSVQHMPYSEVWTPPDEGQYFWQVVDPGMGYPETGGTPFVLAHACENQACAGDALRQLGEGDTFSFLGTVYTVEESREIMKDAIAEQDIWYHDPNRIVVITCIIETTWDQSDKNDIILATRLEGR